MILPNTRLCGINLPTRLIGFDKDDHTKQMRYVRNMLKGTLSLIIMLQPLQLLILHHVFKSKCKYVSNLPTFLKPS